MYCPARAGLFRFVAVAGILGAVMAGLTGCPPGGQAVRVGALFDETGAFSDVGKSIKAGLEIGLTDANDYLARVNADFRLVIDGEDTGGVPDTAAEQAEVLRQRGADIILGPQRNAEADALLPWANEKGVLLLSPSSNTTALSIAGDNLFRMVADNSRQATATAYSFLLAGVNVVVPLYRDDAYGNGVVDELAAYFGAEKQISVAEGVPYDVDTTDFTAVLDALDTAVADEQVYAPGFNVAVYVAAFAEIADILVTAEGFPGLLGVPWYASDSVAENKAVVENLDAAAMANDLGLTAIGSGAMGAYTGVARGEIADHLGAEPTEHALFAYDAVQILAEAYLEMGKDADAEDIKSVLLPICYDYLGVTGWTALNDNGDRAFGNYFVWTVQPDDGGGFVWQSTGNITAK